jgi:hypothetical protein
MVIDTTLLLLLLGYQCLLFEQAEPLVRTRVLAEIRGRDDRISPERFDGLWNLFRSAARRIVTQHVVAEAYGLRNRLASFRHQKELVWRSAIMLLADPGIEEHCCLIKDVIEREEYRDILGELGPSDASLIFTAELQKATIVTDDGRLVHWAGVRAVPAVFLNQI